jgi:type I restriction enzyme M protein
MNNNDLVAKLWKMCDNLRDGGVSYQNYVNELASLLFLKMTEETGQEHDLLPAGMRWADLKGKIGLEQLQFYRNLLVQLGNDEHAIVRAIFQNVNTTITNAGQLTELVTTMDGLDWYETGEEGHVVKTRDDFGDMYEGLLQKNANETKSGAGQYFTPRPLIETMVKLLQPQPREVIQDPAAGTAGFLIEADKYIKSQTNDLDDLDDDTQTFQMTKAFVGVELVPETRRLALMNCLLHDIEGNSEVGGAIRLGNSLGNDGENLPSANVILSNPPFGSASSTNITRTFVYPTSNKQLCFMQHIYNGLEPGGRAAVVIPDNVLFEAGVGTSIRRDLMDKCNLHTILRLPTGIFYAAGVKTNVLFFQKGTPANPNQDKDCTTETWVYDLRTNMQTFGKRSPFTAKHLENFEQVYNPVGWALAQQMKASAKQENVGQASACQNDLKEILKARTEGIYNILGCTTPVDDDAEKTVDSSERVESARWRKFSRQYIKDKDDSLDITWLKDNSITDAANLPAPEVLATEAMTELTEALREMNQLMIDLGAFDEAAGQVALLAEEFGLEKKFVEAAE